MSRPNDRQDVVTALRTALAGAIVDSYREALPIDRYANVLECWSGLRSHCHEHVALWLQSRPADTPVRGWLLDGGDRFTLRFVAHSLVRTADGKLVDVAFDRPAAAQIFITHPETAGSFFDLLREPLPFYWIDVPMQAGFAVNHEQNEVADPFFQTPLSDQPDLL